eukprot:PITA_35957
MNRTVQQMARAILDESGTLATFWGEAAFVSVIILNKLNVQVNNNQTPYELWYECSLNSNDESPAVNQPTYRSMIGSLLYRTGTKPDIMHALGIVGRFQVNPKESHLQEVKRIFKYLQGTQDFGLWYPKDINLSLHAYTVANWVGNFDDEKSTSGGAFYIGSRQVSWFRKKQSLIALSTAEAEYVVDASCCSQLLSMMKKLQDIQTTCTPPISILCHNTSAFNISKNPVMPSKTKHIPIKYHFL